MSELQERSRALLIVLTVILASLYLFDYLGAAGPIVFVGMILLWALYLLITTMYEEYPQVSLTSLPAVGILGLATLVTGVATFVAMWRFDQSGMGVGGAAMLGGLLYVGLTRLFLGKAAKSQDTKQDED